MRTTDLRPAPDLQADCSREDVVSFNNRGLFLGGCPKSGTTLLLSLLDGHPQLVALPEETFYLQERRRYGALSSYEAKLDALLETTDLRLLGKGRFEPRREVRSSDVRDYTGFNYSQFRSLLTAFIQRPWMNDSLLLSEVARAYAIVLGVHWRGCVRWIEKTTSNEAFADVLEKLYPSSLLIQVVRDPRAVFASRKMRLMNNRGWHTKAHRLVREWNRCAREIPRLRQNPQKYLVVLYEDLVTEPNAVIQQICRFAGLDFAPAMLSPTRAGAAWQGNSSFQERFSGIDSTPMDHWRQYLTPDEVWWIEMHCRRGMEFAGYRFESDCRFSLGRWLKRLPGESSGGYLRSRRGSGFQWAGLLKDCAYPAEMKQFRGVP